MNTKVTLYNASRQKSFVAQGRPSDVSDRIIRIRRWLGIRVLSHSTQAV